MIDRFKFESFIKDLAIWFPHQRPTSDYQIGEYYDELKKYYEETIGKAVKLIIHERQKRTFPLIGEIKEVLNGLISQQSYASAKEPEDLVECDFCNGTGVVWIKREFKFSNREYEAVVPCTCRAGEIRKAAYKNVMSKRKKGKSLL